MNSRQRVISSVNRRGYDRLPVKHVALPPVNTALKQRLSATSDDEWLDHLGHDVRWVDAEYRGPDLRTFPDGTVEGFWGERYSAAHQESGVYQNVVHQPYTHVAEVAELDRLPQPAADWFNAGNVPELCRRRQDLFPDGGLILGPTNTIELGTPVENVLAMYEAAGSLSLAKEGAG